MSGRYALHGVIGSGGMAQVHVGRRFGDGGFTSTVAIKRLASWLADVPHAVEMLADEARMASRIAHANVVAMHDVVVHEGELFLVMEHVHGASLLQLVKAAISRKTRLPPPVVRAIVAGALRGLHAAHEAGVIHRDVSPSNILVGTDGIPRLVDFGIAKAEGRSTATEIGERKGKLGFMSPEQLEGHDIDARADVYSAGVVYWEMLLQKRLFPGSSEDEIRARVLRGVVPPPSSVDGAIDLLPEDDAIVRRALRRERDLRFESAAEMADAIDDTRALAAQSEVARWVADLASDALESRRALIDAMTTTEPALWIGDPRPARASAPAPAPAAAPASAPAQTKPRRSSKPPAPEPVKQLAPIAFAAVGAALVVAALVLAFTRRSPTVDPDLPALSPVPSDNAPPGSGSADLPTDNAGALHAEGDASRPRRPRLRLRGTRAGCNPPYTIDPQGVKIWKEDCLR